jgi:hypothetical protein
MSLDPGLGHTKLEPLEEAAERGSRRADALRIADLSDDCLAHACQQPQGLALSVNVIDMSSRCARSIPMPPAVAMRGN